MTELMVLNGKVRTGLGPSMGMYRSRPLYKQMIVWGLFSLVIANGRLTLQV